MKDKFCVYSHTNKINGKKYIGITCKEHPEHRWGKDGKGYKTQPFYRAIEKYGWENFEHEILYKDLTRPEAKKKEQELIKQFHTRFPDGYNVTRGGDTNWLDAHAIYCYETDEIFEDEYDAYEAHKEIFRGKYGPETIIDCCNCFVPGLPVPYKKKKYHYQYRSENMLSIEEIENKAYNDANRYFKINTERINDGMRYDHRYFIIDGKRKMHIYAKNVCVNYGRIYDAFRASDKGKCKKCKFNKIHILK